MLKESDNILTIGEFIEYLFQYTPFYISSLILLVGTFMYVLSFKVDYFKQRKYKSISIIILSIFVVTFGLTLLNADKKATDSKRIAMSNDNYKSSSLNNDIALSSIEDIKSSLLKNKENNGRPDKKEDEAIQNQNKTKHPINEEKPLKNDSEQPQESVSGEHKDEGGKVIDNTGVVNSNNNNTHYVPENPNGNNNKPSQKPITVPNSPNKDTDKKPPISKPNGNNKPNTDEDDKNNKDDDSNDVEEVDENDDNEKVDNSEDSNNKPNENDENTKESEYLKVWLEYRYYYSDMIMKPLKQVLINMQDNIKEDKYYLTNEDMQAIINVQNDFTFLNSKITNQIPKNSEVYKDDITIVKNNISHIINLLKDFKNVGMIEQDYDMLLNKYAETEYLLTYDLLD